MSATIKNTNVSRRNLLKGAAVAAAASSLSAVAFADAPAGMVPGTYRVVARGFKGEDAVSVTVDETSIIAVDVVSTDEPAYLVQKPLEIIPAAIVENQSLAVDIVSGATFTSLAIINAAREAIAQAGGEGLFEEAPAAPELEPATDVECDVLVIGSGGAGCMSALAAKTQDYNNVDSGLNVVLIEKQDILGGSTMLSGGGFFTPAPLDAEPTDELIANTTASFQAKNTLPVHESLVAAILTESNKTVRKLQKLGIGLDTRGAYDGDPRLWLVNAPARPAGIRPSFYSVGYKRYEALEIQLANAGVDVRTATAATDLIVEDGAIASAMVEGPAGTYAIHAKKVILACGGFGQNAEMIAQHAPHDAGTVPFCNGGADGDGIKMIEAVGGYTVGDRMLGYLGANFRYGIFAPMSLEYHTGNMAPCIHVNTEGKRFVCDAPYETNFEYGDVLEQPGQVAYAIVDSENPGVPKLQGANTVDDVVTVADTLEELAEACGIDAAGLVETVEAYNGYVEAGEDPEFGADPARMVAIKTPPFYAVRIEPVHLGSLVGVGIDETCHVLNANGEVIENLYATGELALGGNILSVYSGGWSVGISFVTGALAGEDAKAALLG